MLTFQIAAHLLITLQNWLDPPINSVSDIQYLFYRLSLCFEQKVSKKKIIFWRINRLFICNESFHIIALQLKRSLEVKWTLNLAFSVFISHIPLAFIIGAMDRTVNVLMHVCELIVNIKQLPATTTCSMVCVFCRAVQLPKIWPLWKWFRIRKQSPKCVTVNLTGLLAESVWNARYLVSRCCDFDTTARAFVTRGSLEIIYNSDNEFVRCQLKSRMYSDLMTR